MRQNFSVRPKGYVDTVRKEQAAARQGSMEGHLLQFQGYGPSRKRQPKAHELPETATVIALDPGGTTGWSMMSFHPEALIPEMAMRGVRWRENMEDWKHGQVDCGSRTGNLGTSHHAGISTAGEASGVNELIGFLRAWPGAAVVIEDFILRQFDKGRDLLSPPRITSVLSYDLWLHQRVYFTQQPGLAKTAVTDDNLKELKLYERTGGMGHARDADRHAVTFVRRCLSPGSKGRELREQAWPHLYGAGQPYHIPRGGTYDPERQL